MDRRLRLVAFADTHGRHALVNVPMGDVLVCAGDVCGAGTIKELEEAIAWLAALPHPTKIFVAGNHDWPFQREPARARALLGSGIVYLEDESTVKAGLRFFGSPWQPAFKGWAFNLPRGRALAEKWTRIPEGTDVLITHGPPYGKGDLSLRGQRHTGCKDLSARVAELRPRLHLFGHIHEHGGVWQADGTTFVNCTVDEGRRPPTVLVIDDCEIHVNAS